MHKILNNNSLIRLNLYNLNILVFLGLIVRGLVMGTNVAFDNVNDNIMRGLLIINALYYSFINLKTSYKNIFILVYLFLYSAISLVEGNNMGDVINAQLFLLYFIIFFQIYTSKLQVLNSFIIKVFKICVWLFFATYTLMKLKGIGRPFIMVENNFELLFLGLAVFTVSVKDNKNIFIWLYFIIAIISGSKSAFLISIYLLGRQYLSNFIWIIFFVFSAVIFYILYFGLELNKIDRLTFLLVFQKEIFTRSFYQLLIPGHLIPLKFTDGLDFYTGSIGSANVYYPKVLHSWWMSSILNHGLIVISAYLFLILKSLKNVVGKRALDFIIVVSINALSVSAFDSIWFWFSLLLFVPIWRTSLEECQMC